MSDYELLKAAGHSPAKAAEILDVRRKDPHAVAWLNILRRQA